jgi:excisionase family DNA binding protein
MKEEKLLTIRDVSIILGVSEREVMDLAESGVIPAYKVGGVYLRFKREQVEDFRRKLNAFVTQDPAAHRFSFKEKVADFLYFNDFYILSALLILIMLVVIFKGY